MHTAAPRKTPEPERSPEVAPNVAYSSHTLEFTGYMRQVADFFAREAKAGRKLRVLDIPAGAGQFTDELRRQGHEAVPSDVNEEREEFVPIDMNGDFPFEDQSFDAAVCLEGIEHMIDPGHLMRELLRIVRTGGVVILSTPNVLTFYSRLQFLLTGTFYQFHPAQLREIGRDELADRFHIAAMDYHRLRYLAGYYGAEVEGVMGDRWKRKGLLPLYILFWLIGWPWGRRLFFGKAARKEHAQRNRSIYSDINSPAVLFGRSLVVVLRKREHNPHLPHERPALRR